MAGIKQITDVIYLNLSIVYYYIEISRFRRAAIFYIDYECNSYMDEWNFENWGIKYWSKTKDFIEYMQKH